MWECGEGQTDTQTAVVNIHFASAMPHRIRPHWWSELQKTLTSKFLRGFGAPELNRIDAYAEIVRYVTVCENAIAITCKNEKILVKSIVIIIAILRGIVIPKSIVRSAITVSSKAGIAILQ